MRKDTGKVAAAQCRKSLMWSLVVNVRFDGSRRNFVLFLDVFLNLDLIPPSYWRRVPVERESLPLATTPGRCHGNVHGYGTTTGNKN